MALMDVGVEGIHVAASLWTGSSVVRRRADVNGDYIIYE